MKYLSIKKIKNIYTNMKWCVYKYKYIIYKIIYTQYIREYEYKYKREYEYKYTKKVYIRIIRVYI